MIRKALHACLGLTIYISGEERLFFDKAIFFSLRNILENSLSLWLYFFCPEHYRLILKFLAPHNIVHDTAI